MFVEDEISIFLFVAFCYSLFDDVVKKRKKQCYDDECCIAPGEFDDDETPVEQDPKSTQRLPSKTSDPSTNGSMAKKSKVTPVVKKQKSIEKEEDQEVHEIEEIKPKKKSPNASSVRLNSNS